MDAEGYCQKHDITSESEEWKVALEELTVPGESSAKCEMFSGQVCPVCFMSLRDRLADARRRLKVESRQSVALRSRADQLQETVDAVVDVVRQLTGQNPREMARKTYKKHGAAQMGGSFEMHERGMLQRILPNLIAEAVNKRPSGEGEGESEGVEPDGDSGPEGP